MAIDGGMFLSQNETLPGAYLNFVSAVKADAAVSERGVSAVILPLSWNVGNVVRVTYETFYEQALVLFGCAAEDATLLPVREMLKGSREVLVYVAGSNTAAMCDGFGCAKCAGAAGNSITVRVTKNTAWSAENQIFDVETRIGSDLVDRQTVGGSAAALRDNAFVAFVPDMVLSEGVYEFSGATANEITVSDVKIGLDALENEQFQTLACGYTEQAMKELFFQYTKRCRDQVGKKFQCVLFDYAADYEGVVNVTTRADLVYWVTGALAGCAVQESLTNARYTGELDFAPCATQSELAGAIERGEFTFHRVGNLVRVLMDCNSNTQSQVLRSNQTVRVLDQIANDIAVLFREQYLGKVQNNASGRLSFWNAVVRQHKQLELLGAIEEFVAEDVTVTAGSSKDAVVVTDRVKPSNCMAKLYMTVTVL